MSFDVGEAVERLQNDFDVGVATKGWRIRQKWNRLDRKPWAARQVTYVKCLRRRRSNGMVV